jgi:hypothetical protein
MYGIPIACNVLADTNFFLPKNSFINILICTVKVHSTLTRKETVFKTIFLPRRTGDNLWPHSPHTYSTVL